MFALLCFPSHDCSTLEVKTIIIPVEYLCEFRSILCPIVQRWNFKMDALAEVLNSVRVRSTIYCPVEIAAPWGLAIEEEQGLSFFILTRGSAYLEIEQLGVRRTMKAGDFVIMTKKCACKIADSPGSKIIPLQEWLRLNPPGPDGAYRIAGEGEVSSYIGGVFLFENHESHPLLKVLPSVLHFSGLTNRAGKDGKMVKWFGNTLGVIISEAASHKPGYEIVLNRLFDILFIQSVRAYAATVSVDEPSWFAAAADPQIGAAIAHIHRTPQDPWTVDHLAALAGMSRSAFANRFTKLVGEPPLRYLSRWRMHKAIEMIQESRLTTAEIASSIGYESEAAFSKAFKKWNGRGPGAYRRSAARLSLPGQEPVQTRNGGL
jgi:AraC-like DNA-binding protein